MPANPMNLDSIDNTIVLQKFKKCIKPSFPSQRMFQASRVEVISVLRWGCKRKQDEPNRIDAVGLIHFGEE